VVRRPLPSLHARALMWLSQREHSRHELRQKLQRWVAAIAQGDTEPASVPRPAPSADAIEPLLDALQAAGHLSDERFVEGRVHARSARFGNRRIESELRHCGVSADESVRAQLRSSEALRAREVRAAKFGALPAGAAERARQMRFLAARGFTADAIRHALQVDADAD